MDNKIIRMAKRNNHPAQNATILFFGISRTQLSIARYYGGIKVNGTEYAYIPEHDALIRHDYLKALKKHLKARKSFAEFVEEIKALEDGTK